MLSLFERGKDEEPRVIAKLRMAGCTVHDRDPETGAQFGYSELGGHFAGSLDGVVLGLLEAPKTWHLLEIKTHNDKSYSKLEAAGMQRSKPVHFAQTQMYMGWAGLERAAYVAVNKNDDNLHIERVAFDKAEFERLRASARRIITASIPPMRFTDPDTCKWCDYADVCNGTVRAKVDCRTCQYASPIIDGEGALWACSQGEYGACDGGHVFIPELVVTGALIKRGEGFNVYRARDGSIFANAAKTAFPGVDGAVYESTNLS
jgi:CRISPR/Cas system-associated exonuclease Cas4 (RecB family)